MYGTNAMIILLLSRRCHWHITITYIPPREEGDILEHVSVALCT